MRYYLLAVLLLTGFPLSCLADEFPEKPITIVVYTGPGGLIDITARKIAGILQARHVSVPVVVQNKKGAGGVVGLMHVLRKPADGYTVFGLTSSVVSAAVSTNKESLLDDLQYLGRVVNEYEAIIVKADSPYQSLDELLKAAKDSGGKQIWVGPAKGGTDHIFAQKFWKAAATKARWVPYKSGAEAIAALLGKHGVAYVGNPGDAVGRSDLKLLAVAGPERLKDFPDVPTFQELGFGVVTNESLWRGFAVRKGTPAPQVQVLERLLTEVTNDKEWKEFLATNKLQPPVDSPDLFAEAVTAQVLEDKKYLNS